MQTTVLIFARYPQPGRVKTRMTPPLTTAEAAELHLASLRTVCENLQTHRDLTSVLVATPDQRADELRGMLGGCVSESWNQGDGDLGQRLSRASNRAFEAGADTVLMIGWYLYGSFCRITYPLLFFWNNMKQNQ